VCGLGHTLEHNGIGTVLIGLIPQHVHAMKPPRALLVPFELGRPLGAPDAPQLQLSILREALTLALRTDAPICESYSESEPMPANEFDPEGWACPVSFSSELPPSEVEAETAALLPWYERNRMATGRTIVGLSDREPAEIARLLLASLDELPEPPEGQSVAGFVKALVEDLKAFYFEATLAQPGAPDGVALRTWFWNESAAGGLLRELKERLGDADDQDLALLARFTFVPAEESDGGSGR
jgi:hypothetical protein